MSAGFSAVVTLRMSASHCCRRSCIHKTRSCEACSRWRGFSLRSTYGKVKIYDSKVKIYIFEGYDLHFSKTLISAESSVFAFFGCLATSSLRSAFLKVKIYTALRSARRRVFGQFLRSTF